MSDVLIILALWTGVWALSCCAMALSWRMDFGGYDGMPVWVFLPMFFIGPFCLIVATVAILFHASGTYR